MAPFSASFRFSVGIGPNRAKPGQTGPNRGTMAGAAEMASLSLGVLVPGAEAGRLIGKQGSGLKQIRDMSQCKVQLGQTPDSQGNRRCDISGPTVEHMASAIHAIGTRLFDQAAQQERVQLSVAFPNAYVGRVIGKGGSNLKNIFDQTGVEMKLLKDAVSDQGDRVGHLTGIPNQLGAAIRIALNAVNSNSNTPAPQMNSYQEYNSYRGQPAQGMQQGMNNWRPQPGVNSTGPMGGHMGPPGPMGAGLTQVRPASGTPGEMQIHMVIPSKFVGCILGKEGSQIKQLLSDTGCTHLAVSKKEPYGDADRRVIMVGGYPECAKAQEAVWQIYSENAQQAGAEASLACIMMVPSEKAGAVIGKEGSNLKQMREKFGLKVLLSKEQVEGFRPCTMSGANLEMLLEAEKQILEQISAGTENSAGNGIKRPLEGLVPATAAYTQSAYAADPEAKRHKAMPLEQQIKLLVPAKCAGAIIGKQGSTLTQIRESTGARVEVQTAAQTPPEFANARVVIIRGDFDVRQAALIKVLSAAFEETQANPELKMMVPKQVVGALIGKQGSNLKAIRENSGINVQVHKQELHGERLVEAQGPLDGILHAASLVMGSFEGPRNLQRQRQETRRQFLRVPWRWAWSDGRKEDV
eukprot:s642_g20.t1